MPISSKKNHTHKLKRHKYPTGTSVYFCTLPDCSFKIECQFALGKKSVCNLCNEEFIMTEYTCKLLRPHCHKCSKIRIKGSDGKKRFVRRDSLPFMASLAEAHADNLRERLSNTVADPSDEDI